jgi:hypothetical protein
VTVGEGVDAPYYTDGGLPVSNAVSNEASNIVDGCVAEEGSNIENRGVDQERSNGLHGQLEEGSTASSTASPRNAPTASTTASKTATLFSMLGTKLLTGATMR